MDQPPQLIVAAATAKLPNFWPTDPETWFVTVDAEFQVTNITADATKFAHVVKVLDKETALRLRSLLNNPPTEDKYQALKDAILAKFTLSDSERADGILHPAPLGDTDASLYMDRMLQLRGNGAEDLLFRHAFLQQMPVHVRQALQHMKGASNEELGRAAKELIDLQGHGAASTGFATNAVSEISKRGRCFYHENFGEKARSCREPCNYKKKQGNANADRR
jgi:hypothetical protein